MAKKHGSTIENRVYLFKDLAAAWISANPGALFTDRAAALRALGDLAAASCIVADTETAAAAEVAAQVRGIE